MTVVIDIKAILWFVAGCFAVFALLKCCGRKLCRWILSKGWTYLLASFLFVAGAIMSFIWNNDWHWFDGKYEADTEKLSHFGDFVGGCLGPFLSLVGVLLVLRTLAEQRKMSGNQEELIKRQIFNDLFYEQLHLYQSMVSGFSAKIEKSESNLEYAFQVDFSQKVVPNWKQESSVSGKEFFEVLRERFNREFTPSQKFDEDRERARKIFKQYYIEYRYFLAPYFRTLYRLYEIIDKAEIKGREKSKYSKIVRSQLSESELFLMRYNAMNYPGMKFKAYINRYHILKHLPLLELAEAKKWRKRLTPYECLSMNNFLDSISRRFRKWYADIDDEYSAQSDNQPVKYKFGAAKKDNRIVAVVLNIDNTIKATTDFDLMFDKFSREEQMSFLKFFIDETFIHSNFGIFNDRYCKRAIKVKLKGERERLIAAYISLSPEGIKMKETFPKEA